MEKNQPTYYSPYLKPIFMGPQPPKKSDVSLFKGGTRNYFQTYRNETLSKFSMPRYDWGMETTPYTPRPNIPVGKIRRSINRYLTILPNDISTIDPIRMNQVDNLFKCVQLHRGQYKDQTSTCHPLLFFKPDDYMYQCAPSMTSSYFSKYPQHFIEYKKPTVLPITYERRKQTPYIPDLSLTGIYNEASCIAYKR